MHEFNQSLKYDQRMYAADIRGSIAHTKALTRAGILTEEEEVRIIEGLKLVGEEWKQGKVHYVLVFSSHCSSRTFSSLWPSLMTRIFILPTNGG
jgi:hypothetical protein